MSIPSSPSEETNHQILAVSEDRIEGFHPRPFHSIAEKTSLPLDTVLERIRAMLDAGTIRRVRQTLMATNLAPGALVAWKLPDAASDERHLTEAFEYLLKEDPFSGHIVLRSTDPSTPGASYRLWTTLKVPQGYSLEKHCEVLRECIGAEAFHAMPALGIFALGVGHTRRKNMKPGDRADAPAVMKHVTVTQLDAHEWNVLKVLKRELEPSEIVPDPWSPRAAEIGLSADEFCATAARLQQKGVIGRFSTFLEHVKPNTSTGERVTRFNALFHWAAPKGREQEAGSEIGRHHILTHCYWREGGPTFGNVNIMAVIHGTDKQTVLAHKAAIDEHLASVGIPISYTNVFWGGRSEIKPSEIHPDAYAQWCRHKGYRLL